MGKSEGRARAAALGLRTATKPDSQDVCFIRRDEGRVHFVGARRPLTPGRVVDADGHEVGHVDAVELITVGQRRGLGLAGGHAPRYVVDVDVATATVVVGSDAELLVTSTPVDGWTWASEAHEGRLAVQCSAHGTTAAADVDVEAGVLRWVEPRRRVAPGQLVVLYDGDAV